MSFLALWTAQGMATLVSQSVGWPVTFIQTEITLLDGLTEYFAQVFMVASQHCLMILVIP